MSATPSSAWLRRFRPRPYASLRLVCLPHAGGGANSYRAWAALLPPSVDLVCVQYPGREDRFAEPLVDDMERLVTEVADALGPLLDRPWAVFGHSMGSAVAWELARELRARGRSQPQRLFASGRRAPHDAPPGSVHETSDEALIGELVRLGGTDREVLADPVLRATILGYVRNDYRLIEHYRPLNRPLVTCPVTVFLGEEDPEVDQENARGWERTTEGRVDVEVFPGDHFYLGPQRRAVIKALLRRLDPALLAHVSPWPSTP